MVLCYSLIFYCYFNCVYLVGCANVVVWWWIQNRGIANDFVRGLFMFLGVVGLSYVMVSAMEWARI